MVQTLKNLHKKRREICGDPYFALPEYKMCTDGWCKTVQCTTGDGDGGQMTEDKATCNCSLVNATAVQAITETLERETIEIKNSTLTGGRNC